MEDKKLPSIKKRGRPPGSGRKPLKKWQPKNWEPIYEQIVVLSAAGKSNIDIAGMFGYTTQQVSNVLTCDMGLQRKAAIIGGIRNTLAETLTDRVQQVTDLTVKRAYQALSNDDYCSKNPNAAVNIGLAVTRTLNPLANEAKPSPKNENNGVQVGTVVNINSTDAKDLIEGLRMIQEVKRLNGIRTTT